MYVVGVGIYKTLLLPCGKAVFYSDVVECLPLNPAAQVRISPRVVGILKKSGYKLLSPLVHKCKQTGSSYFDGHLSMHF